MISKYTKAVGQLQELFQELADEGKISEDQAELFNETQKDLVNFHTWVKNQLEGNIKVELPWTDEKFVEAWKKWRKFKKQQFKFTYQPIGEEGALKDLVDLSKGSMETAIAIIDRSIRKGWRGFFQLPSNTATKKLVNQKDTDYDPDFNN